MAKLGSLEAVLMDRLWTCRRPMTVREVLEDLQPDRAVAYTTVMTVMDNLRRKGLLHRQLDGRAYRYLPSRSRDEHTAELLGEALASSEDRATALLHFLEQMPPEEIVRLRDALERRTSPGTNRR